MAKNNNHSQHKPTFAEMQATLKAPKIASNVEVSDENPKIDPAIDASVSAKIDTDPFRWCFLEEEMRWSDNLGFKDYKKDLIRFLQEIELPIFRIYHNLSWRQVNTKPHCGNYKGGTLTRGQKDIACFPYKPDDEPLYHIHISQKHVLFGYRSDDNVFHITINDPDHNFDKL